jgi:signal transduction histidine kinase
MDKHTILIVDDNPDNLQVLFDYLKETQRGYTIVKAISAQMACTIMEKQIPHLVVTDWDMPGMSGIDLIKWMDNRAETKGIPVIVATGVMTTSTDLQNAFESGAVDYIRKPIDPIELDARVRSMLKLADSLKEIQQLNAAKDRLFSIIAHDLSGPFNGILGFSELLISNFDNLTTYKQKEYIAQIHKSSRNGYQLLENLLEWSRCQMSLISYNPQSTELKQVANAVLDLLKTNAENKQISISNHIQPDLLVYADLNMLNSILLNLINNAIKFTKNGGNVTIQAETMNGFVRVTVSDNGVGISDVQKQKLFKIEANSKTAGTNNERGTGLGLLLCKEFVERHGGEIGFESQSKGENTGSIFYFTVPTTDKRQKDIQN